MKILLILLFFVSCGKDLDYRPLSIGKYDQWGRYDVDSSFLSTRQTARLPNATRDAVEVVFTIQNYTVLPQSDRCDHLTGYGFFYTKDKLYRLRGGHLRLIKWERVGDSATLYYEFYNTENEEVIFEWKS